MDLGDHPDLGAEQAAIDRAYEALEVMREDVEALRYPGADELERQDFERWKRVRVAALSDTTSTLVFGRIDTEDDETFRIGRHHVRDPRYDTLVVDWRAPVATAFYRANPDDPMGLRRRRRFLAEGRSLVGISDDDLAGDADLTEDEILQRELDRRRGGFMRDVVATIQAEQDVIVRAPLEGVVVVQGGPGTGKTVVGLHRAAFLLYEHRRRLERLGVLIVGPNPVFIRYISRVLPSLGEAAVTQLPVHGLPGCGVRGSESDDVARVKGDVRMAQVIRRALEGRRRAAPEATDLAVRGVRFSLAAAPVDAEVQSLAVRDAPYREGRDLLRDRLLTLAYAGYTAELHPGDTELSYGDVMAEVRGDPGFGRLLDRVWPSVSPERLVADLLTSPGKLRSASARLLDDGERDLLRRPRTPRGQDEPWTVADGPLIDEARALIAGPPDRYGHVVADEAQDLSPMQLRMLARRCPAGSMTILGDLAQATGAWAHDSWDDVVSHLPDVAATRAELTLGYRLCPAIAELASRVLAEAAPTLRPPGSVRRDPGVVTVEAVAEAERARALVAAAVRLRGEVGAAAVIATRDTLGGIERVFRQAGVDVGHAERGGLGEPIVLVPVERAKGLEFEGVVLAEPAEVLAVGGARLLYVAVTRAMRQLVIVHADELPSFLLDAGRAAS